MSKSAPKLPVTGVVIAKNEGDRIGRCVASLVPLCFEVIVMDSQSTDDTVAAAEKAGARVVQQPWLGFAAQKNAVIALVQTPWVLLLDSDEWLADGADDMIRNAFADGRVEQADVWNLLRRTHYLGTALNHGGWGKEKVARLFRNDLRYKPASVHEALDLAAKRISTLGARIEHDTARSDDEYATKLHRYAALWAQQRHAQGRRAGVIAAPLHAASYWLKNYVLRGGFLDGGKSARYHALHAGYVYEKYRKLRELTRLGTTH
ncbi:MAG: glycosyltransferase family 2 protein [Proteobacteria bacterium]|nr:glycosyltransferase family 2 protein [Pseudomonadota bacterium]